MWVDAELGKRGQLYIAERGVQKVDQKNRKQQVTALCTKNLLFIVSSLSLLN